MKIKLQVIKMKAGQRAKQAFFDHTHKHGSLTMKN